MRICPFCGSRSAKLMDKIIKNTRREQRKYYVRCNSCFARGPVHDYEAMAMMAWDGEYRDDKTKNLFEGENNGI